MRLHFIAIGALVLSSVGCGSRDGAQGLNTNEGQTAANRRQEGDKTDASKAPDTGKQIDAKKALAIAKKDALEEFETLDDYKVTVTEDERGWRVVFGPKDPREHGGGPQYIIDKRTGEILHKVVTQ